MSNENNGHLDDEWKKKFFRTYFGIDVDKETFNKCLDYKNNHIPDSLFKYSKVKNVISLLSDDLMFLPKIEDLNDPFECNIFYDLDILLDKLIDNLDKFIDYSEFWDETISDDESVFISDFLNSHLKNLLKKYYLNGKIRLKIKLQLSV